MNENDNIVIISKDIQENEHYIRERLTDCADVQIRRMRLGDERKVDCLMVYIEVATSNMMLEDSAIGKMVGHFWEISPGEMQEFVEYNSLGIADVKKLTDMEQVFAGLLAGNALATHDLEGALLHTALGQDIYTQKSHPNGHYNHLDVINKVRASGSIEQFINDYRIDNGIMYSVVKNKVPFVLTGSIRDDGPLPEVIGDAYRGQSEMRGLVKKCTTIICLATMLHTIAAGNMTPSFRVLPDGTVRQVYLYSVDADEFVVNKLLDRGSLAATTIVTNVQDFITILTRGLGVL